MAFIDIARLPVKEPREGWQGRFFHSDNMTFAYYTVLAGAFIHEHSHSNDEVWNVIEGKVEMRIGDDVRVLGPGSAAIVPPGTPHSLKVLEDTRALVVDYPLRKSIGGVKL